MKDKALNVLSVAVASGKIGYVFTSDGEVRDWGLSLVASRSPEAGQAKVNEWIEFYGPQLVITEKLSPHTRKSGRTIRNIEAVADAAQNADCHHIEVEHIQHHQNKYMEIEYLARKYPVLENWKVPPRKVWESEAKQTVIWEALAFVDGMDV